MNNSSLSKIQLELDLDFQNVGYIYEFFRRKPEKNAVDQCLHFLDSNATKLTAEEISFADLPQTLVTEVLLRDTFFAKEVDILLALVRWHRKKKECDLQELFEHIRWYHISSKEYADRVRPLNVISDDQYFKYVRIEKPERKSPFSSANQRPESRNSVSMGNFENSLDSTDVHIAGEGQSTSQWMRRSAPDNPSTKDWKFDPDLRKFCCNQCLKNFDDRSSVRRHMRIHSPKRFRCRFDECRRAYHSMYQLQDHYKAHDVDFTCSDCLKDNFTVYSSIEKHQKDGRCAERQAKSAAKAFVAEEK